MTRAVEDIIVALARFDRESGAAVGRTATFEVHDSSPKGRAIAALAKARLVTLDEAAGKQVVRLAHDTLLSHWDRARQVLSKRKGMVVFRERLDDMVDNWKKTRDPAYLLKGLDLEAANALVKEEPAWVSTDLAALVHGSSLALDAEKDELKRRARRERLRWQVASAGSGVLLALLAGLYWYSQKATRAELEATRNLELASQAVQTLATKGFERFVTLSLPSDYGRELLATARDLEEKIASKDAASPPVRFQQAVLLGVTSSYANALGDQPAAEQDIGKAITILAALVEQDPENVEWRRLLAKSNVALGEMLVASGNTTSREKAIAAFNDAQAIVDALLTANPIDPLPDPQDQRLRASIRKGEGDIAAQEWQDAPESADAERASLGKDMIHNYTSMYNILKDYIASDADKLALSEADRTVATAYLKIGQVGEAARYAKEALLVVDQLLTGVSTPPLYQQRKAEVLLLLGRIYVEENEQPGAPAGQTGKVIDALEQARTILIDLVERDPGNDVWRHDLFDAQRRLAALLATPGNAAKARPVAQAAAETAEAIVVRHPNDIASVHDMVAAQSALGGIDLDAGDIDGAIRFLSAARDAGENGPERIPADRGIQMVLADAEGGLAQALSRASPPRFDEAKVALQSRIDLALEASDLRPRIGSRCPASGDRLWRYGPPVCEARRKERSRARLLPKRDWPIREARDRTVEPARRSGCLWVSVAGGRRSCRGACAKGRCAVVLHQGHRYAPQGGGGRPHECKCASCPVHHPRHRAGRQPAQRRRGPSLGQGRTSGPARRHPGFRCSRSRVSADGGFRQRRPRSRRRFFPMPPSLVRRMPSSGWPRIRKGSHGLSHEQRLERGGSYHDQTTVVRIACSDDVADPSRRPRAARCPSPGRLQLRPHPGQALQRPCRRIGQILRLGRSFDTLSSAARQHESGKFGSGSQDEVVRAPRSVRALTALGLLLPLLVTPVLAEDLPNLELQTTINVTAEPGESCEVAWAKRGTYTLPPASWTSTATRSRHHRAP